MEPVTNFVTAALGLGMEPKDLTFTNISLRALVIFVAAIVMVRTGDKRFFSRKSAFDVILGFVLASTLARAINGSAPLFQTIGAGFVLVWTHRLLGATARRWQSLGWAIKGSPDKIVDRGKVIPAALRSNHLSEHDLTEDLRLNGGTKDVADVEEAWIERNGDISVLKKS